MTGAKGFNPYVGLRPFLTSDSRYFFGRDEQVEELLRILHEHRFLPVVGGSGSGKSSLVLAGLIPMLRAGFLVGDRDRWRVASLRPGVAPLRNFAEELGRAFDSSDVDELEVELRLTQADAALDFIRPRLEGTESVLILVDQFEELFAYRGEASDDEVVPGTTALDPGSTRSAQRREASLASHLAVQRAERRAEAADFVDLLLGLAESRELPVFVVLTMRSDFLGDCDLFLGLPEAMNRSRYLVPRLSRDQLRQAIEGPALMCDAEASARLVDRLLNELGDRGDRLPVLQHALQRTWERWAADPGHGLIDIAHLGEAGGLEKALETDAQGALETVDARHAELVFRALTDTDVQQRRIRRGCRMSELASTTGLAPAQVQTIVDAFCANNRNFLFLARDGIADDPRVSISHESLIRQWPTLTKWIDDEARARDAFVALAEIADRWKAKQRDELWGRELEVQTEQWNNLLGSGRPANAVWAARYSAGRDDFALISEFLQTSQEVADATRRRRTTRARNKWAMRIGIPLLVLAPIAIIRINALRETEAAHEKSEQALLLSSIRDLAEIDPSMAAGLVSLIPPDAALSWSEIEALRTIADADVAKEMREGVVSVAVADEGSRFAMLQGDGEILLWPSADSTEPRRVKSAMQAGRYMALDSAGSQVVVTDSSGGIHLKKLDGSSPYRLAGSHFYNHGYIAGMEPILTTNGMNVVGRCDGERKGEGEVEYGMCVWRTTGDTLAIFRHANVEKCTPTNGDLHPDGLSLLVGCSEGIVQLMNITDRRSDARTVHTALSYGPVMVRFSRDGRRALFVDLEGVSIWDVQTGRTDPLPNPDKSEWSILGARFDRSGRRVVATSFVGAVVWEDIERRPVSPPRTYAGDGAEIVNAQFSRSGQWVSSTFLDGTVRLFRVDGVTDEVRVLRGHGGAVTRALFTHDDQYVVTVADDRSSRLWSTVHDAEPFAWRVPKRIGEKISSVSLSANGKRLAAVTFGGRVLVQPLKVDGSTAYQSPDSTVIVYEPSAPRSMATRAHFAGDTLYVLATDRDTVRLQRQAPSEGALASVWKEAYRRGIDYATFPGATLGWIEQGRSRVRRFDGTVVEHRHGEIANGAVADSINEQFVAISRDGQTGISTLARGESGAGSSSLHFWAMTTGKDRRSIPTPQGYSRWRFSVGADSMVAVRYGRDLRILPGAVAAVRDRRLGFTRKEVTELTFSDSGDKVAAADNSGGIAIWEPGARGHSSGSLNLKGMGDNVVSLMFTRDGKRVLSASPDVVRVWTIAPDLLIKRIISYSRVCFPKREWIDRLHKDPKEAERSVRECESAKRRPGR